MINPDTRFSTVSLATGELAIYDQMSHKFLTLNGVNQDKEGESLQRIFTNAVDILNSVAENFEPFDLSSVSMTREGVQIGELFYSATDVEVFSADFNGMREAFKENAGRVDRLREKRIVSEENPAAADLRGKSIQQLDRTISPETKKLFDILGRSYWRLILYRIAAVVYKYLPKSRFVKQNYIKPQKMLASQYLSPTAKKIELIKDYSQDLQQTPDLAHRGKKTPMPILPEAILTTEEMRSLGKLNIRIGGPIAYKNHSSEGVLDEVAPFEHGMFTTTGYGCRGGALERNQIVPTSANYSAIPADANHLINAYVSTGAESEITVIRSGVVDSTQRAEELRDLVKSVHKKPVRVVSHQLNSFEVSKEKMMIQKQHAHVTALLGEDENITVAHLNSPSSRFYNWTRKGVPFKGEKQSHRLNVEGMLQYCVWMLEDYKGNISSGFKDIFEQSLTFINGELSKQSKLFNEIEESEVQIDELKSSIEDLKNQKHALESQIHNQEEIEDLDNPKTDLEEQKAAIEQQIETKKLLLEQLKETIQSKLEEIDSAHNTIEEHRDAVLNHQFQYSLHKFYEELEFRIDENPEQGEALRILHTLLGAQLDVNGKMLDRNHELLLFFALDKKLNVISAINCKSGLDRTGFVHALFLAASELPEEKFLHIIQHWDTLSRQLNKLHYENDYDPVKVVAAVNGHLSKEDLRLVFELKNRALEHFIAVSLPITGISTGIIGGKYGSGPSANLLPLNCFPPSIYVKEEGGSERLVRMINYDKNGEVKGLTSDGKNLITQLSPNRGT